MELGAILLFITVMLAIIIIVALLVIFIPMPGSTLNSTCVSQNNCSFGYVCDQASTGGTGICKAGFGTTCGSSNDCFDDLVCTNSICVAATGITGTGGTATVATAADPPSSVTLLQATPQTTPPLVIPVAPIIPTRPVAPEIVTLPPEPRPQIIAPEVVTLPSTPKMLVSMPAFVTIPSTTPAIKAVPPPQPARLVITNRQSKVEGITPLTDIITSRAPTLPPVIHRGVTRAVIPQVRRPVQDEVTSLDDEVNSGGRIRDGAFDIHSGLSTADSESVSTPYEERDGACYCRKNILPRQGSEVGHAAVIDVCSYSNATIFLLEDGNIISELSGVAPKETQSHQAFNLTKRHRVINNVLLLRVTSFNGYLYGVGADAKVYTLPNTYFSTTNWVWTLADWAPTGITQISSTYDNAYLWLQTTDTGYLYNKPGVLSATLPYVGKKRVYGKDMHHYLDINQTAFSAVVHPSGTIIHDIYDGALSYYDDVTAIRPSERAQYRRIAIINWKPYYVQK
jgi:hypothetical protein